MTWFNPGKWLLYAAFIAALISGLWGTHLPALYKVKVVEGFPKYVLRISLRIHHQISKPI